MHLTVYLQATVYATIKPFETENLCFKKMNDSNLQAIHYQASKAQAYNRLVLRLYVSTKKIGQETYFFCYKKASMIVRTNYTMFKGMNFLVAGCKPETQGFGSVFLLPVVVGQK